MPFAASFRQKSEKGDLFMIIGNLKAQIQCCTSIRNEIGELEKVWKTVQEINGFLDLINGSSDYEKMNAKIEESTHIFICNYIPFADCINAGSSRLLINGRIYDIMLIDNPMRLNRHYEIYLRLIKAS